MNDIQEIVGLHKKICSVSLNSPKKRQQWLYAEKEFRETTPKTSQVLLLYVRHVSLRREGDSKHNKLQRGP